MKTTPENKMIDVMPKTKIIKKPAKKATKKEEPKSETTALATRAETRPAEQTTATSIDALFSLAINKGVDVGVVERLLAMRKEINAENAKKAFDMDMASFQAKCPSIQKTKIVRTKSGTEAYRYAPIDSIIAQVKELLKEFGFSYAIQTENGNEKAKAICIVKHRDGHSEQYDMEVPLGNKTPVMSDSQVMAAASTFAKRYAFCNAFGIMTSEEDTDATPQDEEIKLNDAEEAPAKQPEAPKETNIDYGVRMAKSLIERSTDTLGLIELRTKLEGSKRYTEDQKIDILKAIDERMNKISSSV